MDTLRQHFKWALKTDDHKTESSREFFGVFDSMEAAVSAVWANFLNEVEKTFVIDEVQLDKVPKK